MESLPYIESPLDDATLAEIEALVAAEMTAMQRERKRGGGSGGGGGDDMSAVDAVTKFDGERALASATALLGPLAREAHARIEAAGGKSGGSGGGGGGGGGA
jgi:hypothetical protein